MTYDEYMDGFGSMTPILDTSSWSRYETEKDLEDYVNKYGYAHINPTSTQIDVDTVLWQLNNDIQHPGQKVSKKKLLTGEPFQMRKLVDQRDIPRPTPPDPSALYPTWEVI